MTSETVEAARLMYAFWPLAMLFCALLRLSVPSRAFLCLLAPPAPRPVPGLQSDLRSVPRLLIPRR